RVLLVFLVLVSCSVPVSLWAEVPEDGDTDSAAQQSDAEAAADQENEEKSEIKTVEYRIPEGGYVTDPAIAQDKPRVAALNRIFPLRKSVAGDHALPRPWSVGVINYWQTQDYEIVSASIGFGDLTSAMFMLGYRL
ncbi:MAG: hypothetical protein KAT30_15690, partial [Candidatus Krumholzibacteria bacterium]|nr:hypothetical protein [Candidatus Krumholzibacteria bacterium]